MIGRARKAVIAALGSAGPTVWAALLVAADDGVITGQEIGGVVVAGVCAALGVGGLAYRVPNAGFMERAGTRRPPAEGTGPRAR